MRGKQKTISRLDLAEAIYNLLEEFRPVCGRKSVSKAVKIVNAMIKSITEALRRGEEVQVLGLGTFKIVTRGQIKRSVNFISGGHPKKQQNAFKDIPRVVIHQNPKKVVIFVPHDSLLEFINQENQKDHE